MSKCDFCSEQPVVRTFDVTEGTPWAACATCATLVDAEDRAALARRSGRLAAGIVPLALAAEKAGEMQSQLFWSKRSVG